MFDFLRRWWRTLTAAQTHPLPGQDAQWLRHCDRCDDLELHVTCGGFAPRCIVHCYGCGSETTHDHYTTEQVEQGRIASWAHWQSYPVLPYNWHTLSEQEKLAILAGKPK